MHPIAPPPLAVDARGLVKTFGTTHAVDGIDLAVPRGLVVGFDADGRRTDAIDVTDGDRIFSSSRTGNSAASRQKS